MLRTIIRKPEKRPASNGRYNQSHVGNLILIIDEMCFDADNYCLNLHRETFRKERKGADDDGR